MKSFLPISVASKPTIFTKLSDRGHKTLSLIDIDEFELAPINGFHRNPLRRGSAGCLVLVDALGHGAISALLVAIWLRCPFVIRVRGDFVREQREIAATERGLARRLRLLKLRFMCWIFRRSSAVIFNSTYLRTRLADFAPKASHHVVENPVTVTLSMIEAANRGEPHIDGTNGNLRLLSITNMEVYGKVMGLVNAIQWLGEGALPGELCGKVFWSINGKGRFAPLLENVVESMGLKDVVRLQGFVEDTTREFQNCDIFAHFSNQDAFPNVTLEAMYFGKPIITNDKSCGTLEQVRHDFNGTVVSKRQDFIEALIVYLNNPDLRIRRGMAGRNLLEKRYMPHTLTSQMSVTLKNILTGANYTNLTGGT